MVIQSVLDQSIPDFDRVTGDCSRGIWETFHYNLHSDPHACHTLLPLHIFPCKLLLEIFEKHLPFKKNHVSESENLRKHTNRMCLLHINTATGNCI